MAAEVVTVCQKNSQAQQRKVLTGNYISVRRDLRRRTRYRGACFKAYHAVTLTRIFKPSIQLNFRRQSRSFDPLDGAGFVFIRGAAADAHGADNLAAV